MTPLGLGAWSEALERRLAWAVALALALLPAACRPGGGTAPPPTPPRAPLAATTASAPARFARPSVRADLDAGAEHWARLCQGCHGPTGAGDGPVGRTLRPRPADLGDLEAMADRSPAQHHRAVARGVVGGAMPRFDAALDEVALWDVALHAWTLAAPPDALDDGAAAYAESCAACHGPSGGREGLAPLDDPARALRSRADERAALLDAHPELVAELGDATTTRLVEHLFRGLYAPFPEGSP